MILPLIVLAAGTSSRTGGGGGHKLLATRQGVPLVRHVVLAALGATPRPIWVVTGAEHPAVTRALSGLPVFLLHHAGFAGGLGGSLAAGVGATLPRQPCGVVVMLADMPLITPAHIDAVVRAFHREGGRAVVRAGAGGVAGHPVAMPAEVLPSLARARGDDGARAVLARSGLRQVCVEIGPAALADADTTTELSALGFHRSG